MRLLLKILAFTNPTDGASCAMKKLLLLFVIFIPLVAQAAWIDGKGKPLAETESMRSDGDFGVQLVLTPDDNKFRQSWNSTKNTPTLSSTTSVRLGSSVAAVLIFHGCAPNATGVCDVVSDFILQSPDGTKTPAGAGPVWSSAPLQGGLPQLGLIIKHPRKGGLGLLLMSRFMDEVRFKADEASGRNECCLIKKLD
mgnify:CR=1 FL=1